MTTLVLRDIAPAARLLRAGHLIAFGTETVYGLGGDATNGRAVAGIFEAKGRPNFNPLICHFSCAEAASHDAEFGAAAEALAARFWPGPLTLVLPRSPLSRIDRLVSAGLNTVAVRVPAHEGARAFLDACGVPVAAPSANRSGRISPTSAADVVADLDGRITAVLDFGPCRVGLESTVLDLTGDEPVLLRQGGVTQEAIEAEIGLLGEPPPPTGGSGLRSPGMLASHYAPQSRLRIEARHVDPEEALLAFGEPLSGSAAVWNLSEAGDPVEAASRLFAGLRWLDAEVGARGLSGIAAMPVPETGLGRAINDRLRRAAAPRS